MKGLVRLRRSLREVDIRSKLSKLSASAARSTDDNDEEDDVDSSEIEDLIRKIFKELDDLDLDMTDLLAPQGTSRSPGRTCQDIHAEYPHLQDGITTSFFVNLVVKSTIAVISHNCGNGL